MSAFHSNQLNELLKIHHQQQNTKRLAQCVRLRAARRALQCIWLAKQPNKKGAAGETQKGNAIACMQPQCNVNQCSFFCCCCSRLHGLFRGLYLLSHRNCVQLAGNFFVLFLVLFGGVPFVQ
jgi:hypothetical protein